MDEGDVTIVRICGGVTLTTKAEQYLAYLNKIAIPACRTAEGNERLFVMKDLRGELARLLLPSFWSSDEAPVRFAAADSVEIVNPIPVKKDFSWPSSQPPDITTPFTRPNHHMLDKKR